MKIGVSSYSFMKHIKNTGADLLDVCTLAKDLGFDGIEFINLSFFAKPGEREADVAVRLRERCGALDLPIIAYTVGADFIRNDKDEETARVKACVDIAALLGAPLFRHDVTNEPCADWHAAACGMAAAIRNVTAYAAQKGIRTCTENHGFIFQDANRVEALIREVNHPNYGWLVDIGNFACADQNSIPAVAIAAPYAFHAHVKDFLIKPAHGEDPGAGWFKSRHGQYLRGTVAGHGVIPIRACIQILRAQGYDGWLSYEFEGMEENIPALEAGLANLRKML